MEKTEFLLQTIQQLREEIISTQKTRVQMVGFKLTLVIASIGYIFSEDLTPLLFILVAFGAILFDFLITSHSISIKRAGYYIRERIEPELQGSFDFPKDSKFKFWEGFMASDEAKGGPSALAHLGQTFVVFALAVASPFTLSRYNVDFWEIAGIVAALVILTYFMIKSIRLYRKSAKYSDSRGPNFKTTLWQDLKWFF